jgi:hypothetical protein
MPVHLGHAPETVGARFILIQRLSTENYTTLDNPGDDSLRAETFRLTAYSKKGDEDCHTVADAIAEALDDYEGAMGTARRCEAVFIEDESGDYDPPVFMDGYSLADITLTIQHSPAA